MLELKNVHTYYGNIHALKGVSLVVNKGEVVTLIGSNGAGKTTTLRTIQGILRPRVMLLDEPSMGLAPILVDQIFDIIRELHSEGVTILLVEQNARLALSVADRGYVLETGEMALSGPAKDLLHDPSVKAAYLGEAH